LVRNKEFVRRFFINAQIKAFLSTLENVNFKSRYLLRSLWSSKSPEYLTTLVNGLEP